MMSVEIFRAAPWMFHDAFLSRWNRLMFALEHGHDYLKTFWRCFELKPCVACICKSAYAQGRSWWGAVTGWRSAGHPDSCRRDNGVIDPEILLLADRPTPTAPHGGMTKNSPGTVVCTVRHVIVAHH
jgi:hypothetical protein